MATKTAADDTQKVAESGEKPLQTKTSSDAPKAMDIHPVGTAPTVAAGRPVIVGNKSVATDPMLSANKPSPSKETTPDEAVSSEATTAPVISKHTKTISPVSGDDSEEQLVQENDAVAKSVEAITTASTEPESATAETEDLETSKNAQSNISDQPATIEPSKDEPNVEAKPDDAPAEEVSADNTEDSPAPLAEEDTVVQEKTAEQVRSEQIEEYIQKKTYAVPIDKTGHRRHNAMLALLLVFVAVIITVNFLLDFGVLTISGAPSTDIFPPKAL